MSRRRLLITLVLLSLAGMLAVPAILRAIPSRYVARLPEPFQQLGAPRDQAAILPTVIVSVDASILLEGTEGLLETSPPTTVTTAIVAPATPTPHLLSETAQNTATVSPPTPTALPSPIPTATATSIPIPIAARLEGFVHEFQTWNNCGPATLAMTLSYFDLGLNQKQTAAVLKPSPEDRNVSPYEMVAYVENETPLQAIDRVNGNMDTIRRLVANGIPVVLEIGIEPPGEYEWLGWYGHYLLVVAYDDEIEQFWVYDSWFGTSEEPMANAHRSGRVLTYADAAKFWPQFNRTYIAVYRPEHADLVNSIIGDDLDDERMWQNALATAQKETAAAPDNAFFWFNLGSTYNALGRFEQAATAFDQARSLGLPWRMLWYQFGPYEAYYQVGRYEDVILLADVTLKDRPYFEESYYYRGLALEALGDLAGAENNFEKALAFNPNFAPAATALSRLGN